MIDEVIVAHAQKGYSTAGLQLPGVSELADAQDLGTNSSVLQTKGQVLSGKDLVNRT
jgi:hypothetical protein